MGGRPDGSEDEKDRAVQRMGYLQKVFGCAATGKPEKVLIIFHGEGNNGKTTLLEIVREALGEYAGQVQIDSLMVRPKDALSSNAVNTDIADLRGCRLVSSSEVDPGQHLSLSRVKYLTGLGEVKARRLNENMITFCPTYKLVLDCNHKPVITDPNDAIWNRIRCVEFKTQIPKNEIDSNLPAKLQTELAGILHWIVEGAALYAREGFGDPPEVTAATEEYRQESDALKEFLGDECELLSAGDSTSWKKDRCWIPVAVLYPAYIVWASKTGERQPLPKAFFDERLRKLGRQQDRVRPDGGRDSKLVRVWLGIRFKIANSL